MIKNALRIVAVLMIPVLATPPSLASVFIGGAMARASSISTPAALFEQEAVVAGLAAAYQRAKDSFDGFASVSYCQTVSPAALSGSEVKRPEEKKPLEGQVVLVTGASEGVGKGEAFEFARQGARLVLVSRDTEGKLTQLETELRSQGHKAIAVVGDVTNKEDMDKAVAAAYATYGRLDIVAANAGNLVRGAVADLTVDSLLEQLAVNLFGVINTVQAVKENKEFAAGRVRFVFSGSLLGHYPSKMSAGYCIGKAALFAYAMCLWLEGVPVTYAAMAFVESCIRLLDADGKVIPGKTDPAPALLVARAKKVARRIVSGAIRGRLMVVVPGYAKLVWGVNQHFRGLMLQTLRRLKPMGVNPSGNVQAGYWRRHVQRPAGDPLSGSTAVRSLEGRAVLVTGASMGIGKAEAFEFARQGAKLVLMSRNTGGELKALETELRRQGYLAIAVVGDVTKKEDMDVAVRAAINWYGRLDIVAANAGNGEQVAAADLTVEFLLKQLSVNLFGVINTVQAVNHFKQVNPAGRVRFVFSGSLLGHFPYQGAVTYCIGKAALFAYAMGLWLEGVPVTYAAMGFVDTFFRKRNAEGIADPSIPDPAPAKMVVSAESVARPIVNAVMRGRLMVMVPGYAKGMLFLNQHFRGLMLQILRRQKPMELKKPTDQDSHRQDPPVMRVRPPRARPFRPGVRSRRPAIRQFFLRAA